MKNQEALVILGENFDGLYQRGVSGTTYNTQDPTPRNGWTTAHQVRFTPWGLQPRPGTEDFTIFGTITGTIVQILPYHTNTSSTPFGVVNGYFIVEHTAIATNVYDSNAAVPGNVIASSVTINQYVSFIVLFNRIAFSFHDFSVGANGTNDFIQVYKPGQAQARNAAGQSAPSLTGVNFASSGTAGLVTQGVHVFGLAYETDTGHIVHLSEVPGDDVNFFTLANANQQVTATGLPAAFATGMSKLHIVASRLVVNSSGDPVDYQVFFVHTLTAAAVSATFNFTDESLIDSADYLYDILETIPDPLGMTWYANRLITWGESYAAGGNLIGPSVLRVSEKGKPESFSASNGVIPVFQDDGDTGVKNVWEYKGLLIIQKESRTFVTRDNGDEPNTWEVDVLDGTIGGVLYGIAKTSNQVGAIRTDFTITVAKNGVYLFDGKYNEIPLTWKIERLWQQISEQSNYLTYQLIDIPTAKLLVFKVWQRGCSGSVTGVIGDGGANGWAWLCSDTNGTTEIQADGSGNFTIEDVPCGTYTLYVRDDAETLYGVLEDVVVVGDTETDVGTVSLTESGTAPVCPATPSGASYPYFLVCDYSKGLSYQTVRWSTWRFDGEGGDPSWIAMEDGTNMRLVWDGTANTNTLRNMIIGTENSELSPTFTDGELITGELNPEDEIDFWHYQNIKLRGDFSHVTGTNFIIGGVSNALSPIQAPLELDVTKIAINQKAFFPTFQVLFSTSSGTAFHLRQIVYFYQKNAMDLLGS